MKTNENKLIYTYAKNLFYRTVKEYKSLSDKQKKEAINDLKNKLNERLSYDIIDEYTLAAAWLIRLENYINLKI